MTKALIEQCLIIQVHRLMRAAIPKGNFDKPVKCSGSWQWLRGGDVLGTIGYEINQSQQDSATLTLAYSARNETIRYSMPVTSQPCGFGGWRWFAICPHTGRKVSKLYLPSGAKRFLSRNAYRLAYRSQGDAAGFDRACNQRNRILSKKLNNSDPQSIQKPKGMRWKTFDILNDKIDNCHAIMNAEIIRKFKLPLSLFKV